MTFVCEVFRRPVRTCGALLCCVVQWCLLPALAQTDGDSTRLQSLRFDISGGFYHQMGLVQGAQREQILLPDHLSVRRPQEPELATLWGLNGDRLTDSPMGHGASYLRFHSWYDINDEVELYGSLTANHGGFSFGAYNTFALAILPRYYVQYRQRVGLAADDTLALRGRVGTFENIRIGEGLTLYNMDVQGLLWDMQWHHAYISVQKIGDLQAWIGLAIDGIDDYRFGLRSLDLGGGRTLDLGVSLQNFTDTRHPRVLDVLAVSGAVASGATRLYAEAGYRFSDAGFDPVLNYAALAGVQGRMASGRFELDYRAEYRHYNGGFNYRLRDERSTHYRRTDRPPGANYIGDQVYPIEWVNGPFSQWAVFTEYDRRWVSDIGLEARVVYQSGSVLQWLALVDLHLFAAEGEEVFLYPFFAAGVRVEAVPGTYVAATVTNKTMNLDKHYPTYYLLRYPVLQFELRRESPL